MVIPFRLLLIAVLSLPAAGRTEVKSNEATELYHDYCSVCHGDKGDGRSRARQGLIPPPRDFTVSGMSKEMPRARMIDSVLNGRPGTAMVAWKSRLSTQQAAGIVDYIRANFMREGAPSGRISTHAPDASPSAPPESKATAHIAMPRGNPARGQPLYMANCSTCHGVEGKGDGPRAYFIFPRPRDFTSSQAREKLADSATLFQAVKDGVQGKEMPAWGKVLNTQQIADVSAFVAKQFVQPTTRLP